MNNNFKKELPVNFKISLSKARVDSSSVNSNRAMQKTRSQIPSADPAHQTNVRRSPSTKTKQNKSKKSSKLSYA